MQFTNSFTSINTFLPIFKKALAKPFSFRNFRSLTSPLYVNAFCNFEYSRIVTKILFGSIWFYYSLSGCFCKRIEILLIACYCKEKLLITIEDHMARKQKTQPQVLSGSPNPQFTDYAPEPIEALRAPTTADVGYAFGQLWVDTSTGIIYGLGAVSAGSATWNLLSPGASDVDTLTGDGGGAISPAAGNITLAGGTNITTAGAGSTITFNLDAAITLATSVTSALYTAGAGTDLLITAPVGQDIIMKMGDAAGANKVSFTDTGDVEVFSIDSNGGIPAVAGLTVTGAFTQTAGVVSISEDNSANAVGIANGTTARAIDIGSSAAAHTITIGSATGAASLDLLAGTGNFTLEGATATTYDISATGANTGTCTFGAGTGARIVNLGTGAGGVKTINIGTAAIGNVITIGTVTAAASLDLLCGTGNFTLEGNVASTYDISNTGVNTGAVNIAGGTGARTITIGGGGTGAKTINIGAAASADIITIGDATGAGSLDLVCGTGNFTLEGNVATTYDISNTGVNTGAVNIAGGTGARTITIGGGGTGAKTINIGAAASADLITIGDATGAGSLDLACGTGNFTLEGNVATTYDISATGVNTGTVTIAGGTGARLITIGGGGTGAKTIDIGAAASADIITIGDTTGAGSLDLRCGTGNFTLEGNTATTYDISGTGVNTGTITIGGGTGAQTLAMMNSTGGKTVNIAAGAGANTVTIGSTNTTSSLVLQAGTGDITVTGTVKQIDAEFVEASGIYINEINASPLLTTNANTGGAPTGATGDTNLMAMQNGVIMEQFILGAGQTIIAPRMDANGLLVSLDLTASEGAEYNLGARNLSKCAFTIGTDLAFYFSVGLYINDMDGAAPYVIGFRKVEANNATFANYTDYATIGMIAASSTTNVVTATELNSLGQTVTDTTDAWGGDGATNTLAVLVDASGNVTYTINGAAPSASAAFQFDNADVVVPFIRMEHSASATQVDITSIQCGYQA
jgi:hypothetical protein